MVRASADATLADGIEILLLTGGAIRGDGNDLDNRITGNDQDNLLRGGNGTDTLAGGAGNDSYVVNAGDTVVEEAGAGIDTVRTAGSFTLMAGIEGLILTGSGDTAGTGNGLANRITGNDGANRLDGGAGGVDTLIGGVGDDTYVFSAGDILTEASTQGWDTVQSGVSFQLAANFEALVLTGAANLQGVGNGLANRIIGNDGANRLVGQQGDDRLTGGWGEDRFVFRTGDGRDQITDFDAVGAVHDILHLRGVKAITGFTDLMANHARQWDAGVMIIADNDRILLEGVRLSDLDRGDFVF
jgi:Ca2+-binding RTX toxin-like protein